MKHGESALGESATGKENKKYLFSRIVYAVTLAAVVLSYIFPMGTLLFSVLFPLIFVSFGLCILSARADASAKCGTKPAAFRVVDAIPGGVKALVVFSILYVMVNFMVHAAILANGGPEVVDGVPFRQNHADVEEITWTEYRRLRGAESRLFTGHLLAFAAIPFGYFSGLRKIETEGGG